MIVFVGQVGREMREREAFQELDYRAVFGTIAKWATEIDDPARIPEDRLARLLHGDQRPARPRRHGAAGGHADASASRCPMRRAFEPVETWPGLDGDGEAAEAPVGGRASGRDPRRQPLVAGGVRRAHALCRALRAAGRAPRSGAGISSTRCIPAMPAISASAPNPKLLARIRAADLVCWSAAGSASCPRRATRCSTSRGRARPSCTCIPARRSLAASIVRTLRSTPRRPAFAAALEGLQPPNEIRWRAETATAHDDYLAWTEKATPQPGGVNLGEIMVWLRENLPPDAIRLQRRRQFRRLGASLLSFDALCDLTSRRPRARWATACRPAVALKRLYPDRQVVCLAGDGDFLMNGQEFATAVQYELADRDHRRRQRRLRHHPHAPGARVSRPHRRRPTLKNPDFAAYARAFGGFGVTVEKTADFPAAYRGGDRLGQARHHPSSRSIPKRSRPRRRSPPSARRRWRDELPSSRDKSLRSSMRSRPGHSVPNGALSATASLAVCSRHRRRRDVHLGPARHRKHLRLAGKLQIEQIAEGERDAGADRQQAVIAQDHHRIAAEVALQARALVDVDGKPFIVVIADAAVEQLRVLASGTGRTSSRQPRRRPWNGCRSRNRHPRGGVNRAVDDKAALCTGASSSSITCRRNRP